MASTSALAPALNSSTTRLAVREAPLSRNPSYAAQPMEREQLDEIYRTGVYADPKPAKHWGLGQALFTPDHKKLLTRFRDECARLSGHNKDLRDRVSALDRKVRNQGHSIERLEVVLADHKLRLMDKNEQLADMAEELREAQASLAEMDAIFSGSRHKRLSRMQAKTQEISEDAKAELARLP